MKVQSGQVWQDNDRRNNFPNGYRTIKIKEVDSRYAYGIVEQSGKPTRILLHRFNPNLSTGYTLIKEDKE